MTGKRHEPSTVWLTGLSGAGKSTLATALRARLDANGRACTILDGDVLRRGLCADLGFSAADRHENVRRVAEVARILNDAGVVAIVALISPLTSDRLTARHVIGSDRFLEAYVRTALATCIERDPKGLYRKALAGEIPDFTGISAPYEEPLTPALVLETERMTVDACVESLLNLLTRSGD